MKNILILDDEKAMTLIINKVLAMNGYKTSTANSPVEALEKLHEKDYDLLFTDYMMPDMNGLELCEVIRKDENLKSMKIIMLSAKTMDTEETRRLTELDVLILRKPFTGYQLQEHLDKIL